MPVILGLARPAPLLPEASVSPTPFATCPLSSRFLDPTAPSPAPLGFSPLLIQGTCHGNHPNNCIHPFLSARQVPAFGKACTPGGLCSLFSSLHWLCLPPRCSSVFPEKAPSFPHTPSSSPPPPRLSSLRPQTGTLIGFWHRQKPPLFDVLVLFSFLFGTFQH